MIPRIAVIGCGQWGRNHVRTLAELGALAGVADRDPARAQSFAERHGVPALSPDAAVASPAIDALVLALPAALHGPLARRAFAAGKDVLIEKPIALDPADAERSAREAAAHGRILMVGHVLRFHPVFRRMAAVIAQGRIGTLRHIAANRIGFGRFPPMDAVWDLAPHDVSLVLHLAGSAPLSVRSFGQRILSGGLDAADIRLGFAGGVTAEIHVSRVAPYRDRRFTAIGSAGMLVFDDLAAEGQKLVFQASRVDPGPLGPAGEPGPPETIATEPGLPLEAELRHFIDCIATRQPPETGPAEAVETVRILAAVSPDAGSGDPQDR